MVCNDQHSIVGIEGLFIQLYGMNRLGVAGDFERWHERVVVVGLSAFAEQKADDVNGGRLAHVLDIALVGNAEDEHAAATDGLAVGVEGVGQQGEHIVGHIGVYFGGKLYKAGIVVERL